MSLIEGLLDPPGNICILSKSYSAIHLQWNPPFSLLNTSDLNDTTHFVVSIFNKLTSNVLYETTVQPNYVYQRCDYVHCSGFIFKIAAVNQVGRGAFSEGIEAGFTGRKLTVYTEDLQKKHVSLLSQVHVYYSVLIYNTFSPDIALSVFTFF